MKKIFAISTLAVLLSGIAVAVFAFRSKNAKNAYDEDDTDDFGDDFDEHIDNENREDEIKVEIED